MKSKAIVLDVDNVILNTNFILQEIHEFGLKGDEMWEYFYANCNSDRVEVIIETKEFILKCAETVDILLSTARNEKCKETTLNKLQKEGLFFLSCDIHMRSENDFRLASEVKKDHLIEIMKDYDIITFIDDDLTNCQIAKELGILALRRV